VVCPYCSATYRCDANSARLKKVKSRLLFRLHVQEYVELIKAGDLGAALRYARRHLQHFAADEFGEFKRAMVLLVIGKDTRCARYHGVLSDARWTDLCSLFLQALLRINNLTAVPLLELQLQVRSAHGKVYGRGGSDLSVDARARLCGQACFQIAQTSKPRG
jgi:CTLH/CRA C-terminal to LisH motif domain